MTNYFRLTWHTLRASYWFIPSILSLAAIVFSTVTLSADSALYDYDYAFPKSIQTTTDAARSMLSLITSSMLSITGTVFSITIVTLSLASQQFGPRLLRSFMIDRSTQLTLGVFVATGLYSALVLRVVEDSENSLSAPHLSVTIALLFAVFAIAMLIYFIHHIAVLIQAPEITDNVRQEVASSIDRLYPEKVGISPPRDTEDYSRTILESLGQEFVEIRSNSAGYVQAVESESLFEMAKENNIKLELLLKPGSFIAKGDVWAKAWGTDTEELQEKIRKEITSAIILGNRRTPLQDVQCSLDELVEVAVRSLSPGINDPFTAINSIDWLGDSLARLVKRELPSPYRYDESGTLRMVLARDSFEEMCVSVFSQIQPYATDNFEVTLRLLKNILRVAKASDSDALKKSVFSSANVIVESISIPLGDLERKRLAKVRAQILDSRKN